MGVSRRLDLVCGLPDPLLQAVREGTFSPWAATRILAPLARANSDHGQRHEYAQMRYQELTGWAAPVAGGPRSKELTAAQKLLDREARLTISRDLGHEREQIAANLGR